MQAGILSTTLMFHFCFLLSTLQQCSRFTVKHNLNFYNKTDILHFLHTTIFTFFATLEYSDILCTIQNFKHLNMIISDKISYVFITTSIIIYIQVTAKLLLSFFRSMTGMVNHQHWCQFCDLQTSDCGSNLWYFLYMCKVYGAIHVHEAIFLFL